MVQNMEAMKLRGATEEEIDDLVIDTNKQMGKYLSAIKSGETTLTERRGVSRIADAELKKLEDEILGKENKSTDKKEKRTEKPDYESE